MEKQNQIQDMLLKLTLDRIPRMRSYICEIQLIIVTKLYFFFYTAAVAENNLLNYKSHY